MLDLVNYSFAVFPSLRHSSSHDNALQTAQTGLNEPNELTHKPQTCAYFYLTHMVALRIILTINHRRDRKGKREGDRWAESMLPVCLQAWLLTSTEIKEQGSLLDMLGFPTVHSPEMRYKRIGIHCMFWGQVLIAYATQKHESGSVSHNSVRFSRWILTKLVWWAPTTQALARTQRHGAIMTAKCSEENVDQGH